MTLDTQASRTVLCWRSLLLLGAVSVLALGMLEVCLRVATPFGERVGRDSLVLPAHTRRVISSRGFPAVDREIGVSTNALGFRGAEPPVDLAKTLGLVAIGGGTTESLYVSDGKTWPELVGRALGPCLAPLWINNAGLDGHSTFGHRLLLERRIAGLRPKVALFLIGLDDAGRHEPTAADGDFVAGGGRETAWGKSAAWMAERSAIVSTALNVLRDRQAHKLVRVQPLFQVRWAPVLTPDPGESRALMALHGSRYVPAYASRVADLVLRCRGLGIEPVLITQPALYGNVVDPETKVFLGTLEVDPERGLHGALAWSILELYNDAVRRIGREQGVLVVDLAREMPKSSRLFYDFVHFNNDGSRVVAEIVANRLRPFLASRFGAFLTSDCPEGTANR
jgi:GDSL-like Lipase/Acylhydrolase family